MISSIFIDRPRLAVVISVVITLAGADRADAIPIAQFPDIVPPQVAGDGATTPAPAPRWSRRRSRSRSSRRSSASTTCST